MHVDRVLLEDELEQRHFGGAVGPIALADEARPSLVGRLTESLTPFTDEEIEAASAPHPHAFQSDDAGLFPVGEVSVIAAPGREGKTFATIAIAVSYVLGRPVVGLYPQDGRSVIVYSAEDDRPQYVRKLQAASAHLDREGAAAVRQRIIVPDLTAEGMDVFCALVTMHDRQPVESLAVDALIDALRGLHPSGAPAGMVIFETASTLSEAEEDNRAFRVMIKALRRIARELQVAVVLVHHTSQAAASNLPDLNLSVADIRGATALAFNARQCFLLVNLGSDEDPLPDTDARAVLRFLAAPTATGRVTALICLDSSKAVDPPPIFLRWGSTAFGPALSVAQSPTSIAGARWRKVHHMLRGKRAEQRQSAKDQARSATVLQVVGIVEKLHQDGKQASARAVSTIAGRGAAWATPYLAAGVDNGDLVASEQHVPRTKGLTLVYRPADSSAHFRGIDE